MDLLSERSVKRLKRLALRKLDLALPLAAGLGTVLGPGSRWAPTPEEIAAVLGERRPRAVRAIQRRMAANVLRSLALGAVANRRGLASVSGRVRVVHPERLFSLREQRTPLVVVVAHVGAGRGGSAMFEQLGVPARVATLRPPPAVVGCVRFERVDDATRAARFLRRAAADLEEGVVPIVPFDGALDGTIPVSFLGRQLEVGRGLPFLAARGARLVPVTSRWVGNSGRVEATVHSPFPELGARPSVDRERAFVESIARWFEDYVRRNPGELRLWKLRDLHAAKPTCAARIPPRDAVAREGGSLKVWISMLATLALFVAAPAAAQDGAAAGGADSLEDTARKLNNPISNVWNIVIQNNYTLLDGDISDSPRGRWLTNVQPVMPAPLTENWNLIARPIIPLVSAPVPRSDGSFDREGGLGDIAFQAFVSPRPKGGLTWGVGPVFVFPSATDDHLGAEKWSAGPAAVLLSVSKNWVVGGLLSHVQSYAGADDRSDVSLTAFQYFVTRMLPNQWQVGLGSPTITANWEADSDDRWTFPIGLSVGKTIRIGKMPFQMGFETSYAVIHPDTFGERWNFRLILKPVVPALIKRPLFGR